MLLVYSSPLLRVHSDKMYNYNIEKVMAIQSLAYMHPNDWPIDESASVE